MLTHAGYTHESHTANDALLSLLDDSHEMRHGSYENPALLKASGKRIVACTEFGIAIAFTRSGGTRRGAVLDFDLRGGGGIIIGREY